MAWTSVKTWSAGDLLPASDLNTYLRDNLTFLHDRGADLASAGTVTPTTQFHKVTGTTTIDNIAAPTDGNMLYLWFGSALTVRNNGGGTGNIRTASGLDKAAAADAIVAFRSDGTVWKEVSPGAPSGMTVQGDSTLGSSAASIDFQNIPAGAAHMRVLVYARSDVVAATDDLDVRFNNDSGANYDAIEGSTAAYALTSAVLTGILTGSTAVASSFGALDLIVSQYAGTTGHKSFSALAGNKTAAGSGLSAWELAGLWRSTAAISRVTLLAGGGNLIAGSRATVYLL